MSQRSRTYGFKNDVRNFVPKYDAIDIMIKVKLSKDNNMSGTLAAADVATPVSPVLKWDQNMLYKLKDTRRKRCYAK